MNDIVSATGRQAEHGSLAESSFRFIVRGVVSISVLERREMMFTHACHSSRVAKLLTGNVSDFWLSAAAFGFSVSPRESCTSI